ncbi:MAG: Holliday junction resolvase [Thermoplasmata archaeon]|nr:Holliday junction resolvase [Thermoplasmata archaeon]
MFRGASGYERELKELLQGDPEAIERYGRGLDPVDREVLRRSAETPFLVVRAAGSLGFDLVAMRSELAFPVEVKASSHDTIHFSAASGRAAEQLVAQRRRVERVGLIAVYAYRRLGHRGGDPWRVYAAPTPPPPGRVLALVRKRLPVVDKTAKGNAVLRWDDGMPLVRFLEAISFWTARPGNGSPP